ncbi:MAG: YjfB family protein [Lachnospiraceae bacterium]|nr:YjfB family protein [Lachnospiraceae bacterium]
MDITEVSMAMSQTDVMVAASTAVLGMSLDMLETSGESMVKMMELSVNPNLGSNIDVSI